MKKILFILLAISALFISCSSKEETLIENKPIVKIEKRQKKTVDAIYLNKLIKPVKEENILAISSSQELRDKIKLNVGGETSGKYHDGIDFVCKEKTPVLAVKDGIVRDVYPSLYNGNKWKGHPIYGGLIIIDHSDGTTSLYAHLSFTEVRECDEVIQGQEIGWSGGMKGKRGSGVSTGAHLHFNYYLNINYFLD